MNTAGLLMVRGPQVMQCYYGDPSRLLEKRDNGPLLRGSEEASRSAIDEEGWLDTGDIALLDEEGFIYIKDRCEPAPVSRTGPLTIHLQ